MGTPVVAQAAQQALPRGARVALEAVEQPVEVPHRRPRYPFA